MNIFKKIFASKKEAGHTDEPPEKAEILPPLEDPHVLPTRVEDFKEWHVSVLRRLNKHPEKVPFSGIITKKVDIPRFIPILQELELIDWATYDEALMFTKNDTLKEILRQLKLKVSGNKKELVDRILTNADELSVRALDAYSDCYILTEKGQKIVDEAYPKYEAERLRFFETAINLIMQKQLDQAYRMICKRNAELPIPPGFNSDWESRYYEGIPQELKEQFDAQMSTSTDKLLTAAAIFTQMSGDALRTVQFYLHHVFHVETTIIDSLRDENSTISANRDFSFYLNAGVEKYRFLATLDKNTCPICGNLDRKVFDVSERKTGVNCPPMHSGCRCTTVGVVSEELEANLKRRARDPITGKGMLVPMTMTWAEWKDMYLK